MVRRLLGLIAADPPYWKSRFRSMIRTRGEGLRGSGAGVTAIIQPGGSRRHDETIEACDEHDIAMILTGRRHFRH